MNIHNDPNAARKAWMSLLAKSPAESVSQLWEAHGATPEYKHLRPAEIGSVMVRGRAGATGDAFNLGEMTVTRCSVRLAEGFDGHSCVQGRNKTHAEQAALIDALMQTQAAETIDQAILLPLRQEAQTHKATRSAKAASTKVDFFTMVRGED